MSKERLRKQSNWRIRRELEKLINAKLDANNFGIIVVHGWDVLIVIISGCVPHVSGPLPPNVR